MRTLISTLVFAVAALATSAQAAPPTKPVFSDAFDATGTLNSAWQVATWVNGHPFGCTFSNQDVSQANGVLTLSFSGHSGKCAEVRTVKFWQYGKFQTRMQPAAVPGTVSSFFLYAGAAGTSTHHEVDIEFLGSRPNILHTNYWVAGQPQALDIDLTAYGIDPQAGPRFYGFEWRADSLTWFTYNDAGQYIQLRKVPVSLSASMQLMMNAWYGDNLDSAFIFPGAYDNTPGAAVYDSVQIYK